MRLIERPTLPIPGVDRFVRDFGPVYAASGFVGFIFAATGPLAIIILSVGTGAGLTQEQLASWVFGVFFVNGAITLVILYASSGLFQALSWLGHRSNISRFPKS